MFKHVITSWIVDKIVPVNPCLQTRRILMSPLSTSCRGLRFPTSLSLSTTGVAVVGAAINGSSGFN